MIIIKKDRILHEYFDNGQLICEDIAEVDTGIVKFLVDTVRVDEDVTVEDLLAHLIDYEEDLDFAMEASLGGYPLGLYLEELSEVKSKEEHLVYAEFSHETSMIDGVMNEQPRFGAMGTDVMEGTNDLVPFSVELAPIATYKHLFVRLNHSFVLSYTDDEGNENIILEVLKEFTLYDIFHALLFEISYYGTPEMRGSMLTEVVESLKEAGNELNMSAARVVQLKELEISRLEEELRTLVDKEDYEASAVLRDRIASLKKDKSEKGGTNA